MGQSTVSKTGGIFWKRDMMGHRGDNSRGSLGNREGWKAGSDLDLDVAWVAKMSSREDRACARFRLH